MRDVVVIGGGLSGLAACRELEKQSARYTLIEVKDRFGGSIRSQHEKGFISDASAFAISDLEQPDLLEELGLAGQRFAFEPGSFGLRCGTGALIEAMARDLSGGRLMRMAVSSIGRLNSRFTLCLENGFLLDAFALILAVPARYSQRMLHNLAPEASRRLRELPYDRLYRVSLGYHKRDLPRKLPRAHSVIFPFVLAADAPGRVPDADHLLLQVAARSNVDFAHDQLIQRVIAHYGLDAAPIFQRVDFWREADPLSPYADSQRGNMADIKRALPDGISLIGSDYCLEPTQDRGMARLDERLRQGKAAALAALDHLRSARTR